MADIPVFADDNRGLGSRVSELAKQKETVGAQFGKTISGMAKGRGRRKGQRRRGRQPQAY